MSTPLAQLTQQTMGKPASSSSVTTNSFPTFSFGFPSSNSNANAFQPAPATTNAAPRALLPFPIRASIPPPATTPSVQVASAQTLFQAPPQAPLTPKSSSIAQNDIVATTTPKKHESTGTTAQKILGPMPHPDFSFDDGNITLQVGHMTFTVHRYSLVAHSAAFRDMFSLGPESTTEGAKENPIVLHHLDAIQFERLLRVLYPRRFDELPFKTAIEWYSVLQVADMFGFRECGIRKLAIEQLEKTASCVQKIIWGEKYGIKSLLLQGYREACNRRESFTSHEFVQLLNHPQTLELVMRKREMLLYDSGRCGRCPRSRAQVSDEELGIHFQAQLKNAQ